MEVMPLRYGCELGTVDGKAHHGCHETGKKEREKGMQSINQKRRDIQWIGGRRQKVDKLTTETKMPFSTPTDQRHS